MTSNNDENTGGAGNGGKKKKGFIQKVTNFFFYSRKDQKTRPQERNGKPNKQDGDKQSLCDLVLEGYLPNIIGLPSDTYFIFENPFDSLTPYDKFVLPYFGNLNNLENNFSNYKLNHYLFY